MVSKETTKVYDSPENLEESFNHLVRDRYSQISMLKFDITRSWGGF